MVTVCCHRSLIGNTSLFVIPAFVAGGAAQVIHDPAGCLAEPPEQDRPEGRLLESTVVRETRLWIFQVAGRVSEPGGRHGRIHGIVVTKEPSLLFRHRMLS
jgi:hypothetical protein